MTTTTCAPSTTITVTGCSVTPATTTVTKGATCRPRTTSTCVKTTAPQVTVVCKPRYRSEEGSITTTTTCSPSTTMTVTGCSVTPSTTTITKEATCHPRTTKPTSTTFVTTTKPPTSISTPTTPTTATSISTITTSKTATLTVRHDILPAFPTTDASQDKRDALCFRDINKDHRYGNFSVEVAGRLTANLCMRASDAMFPVDDPGRVSAEGEALAWMRWAQNQSGCQPQREFLINGTCISPMLGIEMNCDFKQSDTPGYFGGGFVMNSNFGCLEFGIVSDGWQ
ncbi:hypothetical protein BJX99DRAFT_264728 [Aspergillus californicus]